MAWLRVVRLCKLGFGLLWAGVLILLGLWSWRYQPALALCPLAGGEFLAMWLIADDVAPRANPAVTGFVKLVVCLIFWMSLATGVVMLWQ